VTARGGGGDARRRRGGGRADGWPCGGGDGGRAVRSRTVCSRNAVYGGENGGTAATSSGLAPRNGPNCFVFHFFVLLFTTIKHIVVVVFHNDYRRVVPATGKYLPSPSGINYIECSRVQIVVVCLRSSSEAIRIRCDIFCFANFYLQ